MSTEKKKIGFFSRHVNGKKDLKSLLLGLIIVIGDCFLLSFIFTPYFTSLPGEKKDVSWVDFTDGKASGKIKIDFRNPNGRGSYTRKLKCNETKSIKVKEPAVISGDKHGNGFMAKIYPYYNLTNYSELEIFLFPERSIHENDTSYIVPKIDGSNVVAYYIEGWDNSAKKNYYIFSKDNIIEKQSVINEEILELDELPANFEKDIAYYINQEQELGMPYNGFVVRSNVDDSYVFLSTLWD